MVFAGGPAVTYSLTNDAGGRFDSESQAALRVVQPARGNFVFTDGERFPALYFLKLSLRAHHRHVHGKVRYGHLRFKHLFQAVAAQEFRAEAIEFEFVVWQI